MPSHDPQTRTEPRPDPKARAAALRASAARVLPVGDVMASAVIAELRAAWRAYAAVDQKDDDAEVERVSARREGAIDAAERLPATSFEAIQAKALALAWIEHVDVWKRDQERAAYATNGRLALDIAAFMAGLAGDRSTPALASAKPERDWQEWASHHPGFVPCPADKPVYLAALEVAIPAEARRLLDLAHTEIGRRRQAYEGHPDTSLWPSVERELRHELRIETLEAVTAPLGEIEQGPTRSPDPSERAGLPDPRPLTAGLDTATASFEALSALHDMAHTLADVASASTCQPYALRRDGTGPNAGGHFAAWIGDIADQAAVPARREAAARTADCGDANVRLAIIARGIIHNGGPEQLRALARDLEAEAARMDGRRAARG